MLLISMYIWYRSLLLTSIKIRFFSADDIYVDMRLATAVNSHVDMRLITDVDM